MSASGAAHCVKRGDPKGVRDIEWGPAPEKIIIGKDVLELLSTSMYVDPLTIYREYIQNSADAIDQARSEQLISPRQSGRVEIAVDPTARIIRIRDNGAGISAREFAGRMSKIGASEKRGTSARGFRGVGRLAGLGYCQELVFKSRRVGEAHISELRWDCRKLKSTLRLAEAGSELSGLIRELVAVRKVPTESGPSHFFEVELRGVVRHRNDQLLNAKAVSDYLAQVAPLPFAPGFRYGEKIAGSLAPHVALGQLEITVDGSERPLYRPHANRIEVGEGKFDKYGDLQLHEIPNVDGGVAALVWVLHHGYSGALPAATLVRGLRFRAGNIQVGDNVLLEGHFSEPRFNSWAVGEIHIVDNRIVPNGRRDHFEQNIHFDNVLNHLGPILRDISRRCRQSSADRKWLRDFEFHKRSALEHAQSVRRRGISKSTRATNARAATRSLSAMEKVANQRTLDEEIRAGFLAEIKSTKSCVSKLLAGDWEENDPFAHLKPPARAAYKHIIQLIYDCASNSAAAQKLVDKILAKFDSANSKTKVLGVKAKNRG